MLDFDVYQDTKCIYPMNGQYGYAPRVLYYFLLLFVVVLRREDWLAAGAAANILTYGGGAAIHAFILACILPGGATQQIPNGVVQISNGTQVYVEPLVADQDYDSTIAVVGAGFLVALPLALWSSEFRLNGARPILFLWTLLIFVGMVCCFVSLYSINNSFSGPYRQFQFCPTGHNDTLPISGGTLITMSNASWNETVWDFFAQQDPNKPTCFFPCLAATEILRQPTEITVIPFTNPPSDNLSYWGVYLISAVIYGYIPLSGLSYIGLLFIRSYGFMNPAEFWQDEIWSLASGKVKFWLTLHWAIDIYARILTLPVFAIFLVWTEWSISFDQQVESMRQVGQWTPLLGAGLVFVAAVIGKYWREVPRFYSAFKERRIYIKRESIREGWLHSVFYAWVTRNLRLDGAWGRETGYGLLQNS